MENISSKNGRSKGKVVVLMDNENRNSRFLEDLGKSDSYLTWGRYLCRSPTQAEIDSYVVFNFETFGLLTLDHKLDDYIKSMDGIIILIDYLSFGNNMFQRIKEILQQCPDLPVLIVMEKYVPYKINGDPLQYFKEMTSSAHRKSCFIDFSDMQSSVITDIKKHEADNAQINSYKKWFSELVKNRTGDVINSVANKELTSVNISTNDLVNKFQNLTLSMNLWDHYGRLRIVYYSIMTYGLEGSIDPSGWLCTNWKRYKTSIGHGNLWHYTLTRFWINILYGLQMKNKYKNFKELYDNNPQIHNGKFVKNYYSDDVLFSDRARNVWVPPNLVQVNVVNV